MDEIFNSVDISIPRDVNDDRFVKSFDVSDSQQSKDFFEEYGFVVFSNILTEADCIASQDSMWKIVENTSPGLDRKDTSTWSSYKSAGKYGLSMRGPCFHGMLVQNRQNEKLIAALRHIIGDHDILVGHDRFTIYRATHIDNGQEYSTGPKNLHLDLNPW